MIKILIENSSYKKISGKDIYGAKFFMQEYFKKNNIFLVSGSIHNYNKKNKSFVNTNGLYIKTNKQITPDIIRNRKSSGTVYKYDLLKDFIITPSQKIANIGNDKYENYLFLQKRQPKTFLLNTFFKNNIAQKELPSKIIIKPLRANGGKGIILTTKTKLLKTREEYHGREELYVVQSFKDFSGGYPGICTCNHDIRLMFAGKNIIEMTLRTPKKGDFRSNIGSGGTQKNLQKGQIPKDLLALSIQIYKDLNLDNTDIFSMDFAYCKKDKQRYLLEINSCPGTRYYQEDKNILKSIYLGLVNFFLSLKSS